MSYHTFDHPIRSVAVVGSGASGTPAARHLRDAGLDVTVFERQPTAGGIWNWSPEITKPLSVPTPPPSRGAFFPSIPAELGSEPQTAIKEDADGDLRHRFSPPNPVYWSLSNNVPTSTMAFKDFPYPPGTAENIPHQELAGYLKSYSEHFELDKITSYNTRVEKAVKVLGTESTPPKWRLTLRKLESEGTDKAKETFWVQDFDALVVATGHYNAPFIPNIEGSSEWAAQWPTRVLHSSGYRKPDPFTGKNVLIIGIGTSGIDIARDLATVANKVYLVGRNKTVGPDAYKTQRKFQRYMVPKNGEAVPEIKRFLPPTPGSDLEDGQIELTDGRIISGLSVIIFATGFQYSTPFLPQFHHDPVLGKPEVDDKARLLITDGGGVLNLYRDVFYVPDPTLTFLGLSVNTSAFSFFEYQSLSIVRVYTGTARLPDEAGRRAAYKALVAQTGEGKFSHLMNKDNERKYVRETVEWLNRDAEWSGADKVEGHTPEWLAASDRLQHSLLRKYGLDPAIVLAEIQAEIAAEKARNAAAELPVEASPQVAPLAAAPVLA